MRNIVTGIFALALTATACQESMEERCLREARDFTDKQCPVRIDQYTVMDSMTFDPQTHTITYAYTLGGRLDDSVVVMGVHPREALLKQLRNATNLQLYKEAGYSFRYTYFSAKEKGARLFEAVYHEKDYR